MTIQISRNAAGNCVNFSGATQPVYWNACLSAQVNAEDNNRVNVVNDIRSAAQGTIYYEFFAVDFAGFSNATGDVFTSAQEMVDYVNEVGNVAGATGTQGIDLNAETAVNFRLDDTQTSILVSTGNTFGVNTIKALADVDGTIHIQAVGEGKPNEVDSTVVEKEHFQKLIHTEVLINGVAQTGGLLDVVNALNELFTVGPFEAVVITDPDATTVADVAGEVATYTTPGANSIDPIGADILGTTATHNNAAGLLSDDYIDQAGEYFTFDIAGKATYGFGLVHTQASFDNGKWQGNSSYADPAGFCVGANSSHLGYQFSHHFHIGNAHASWTNYGANTSYVMGPAWFDHANQFDLKDEWNAGDPVKVKVGLDNSGFIEIATLDDDGINWNVHARSAYPVPEGFQGRLGIKLQTTGARIRTAPKKHLLEPAAPVLNFRYVESPDGVFHYPVFATEEEANYYDLNHDGTVGTGTSHTEIFPDDPTNTVWYMPDTGSEEAGSAAPTGTFQGNTINWTEVTTLVDADLAPSAFSSSTVTVDELTSVAIQIHPAGATWSTTITDPSGNFTLDSISTVVGTAPEVTPDNVTNPYDDYPVTVTRTNSYGSSTGTLTIRVNNLTAPTITAVNGVTHEATSTALVDTDTLGVGSVVKLDNILDDGNRLVMDEAFVTNYVIPAIDSGSGEQRVLIGFGKETGGSANWSSVTAADFELAFEFFSNDVERPNNRWRLRTYKNGTQVANVGIGSTSSGLYNYIFVNDGGTIKIAGLLPSYGDASSFVWDASSLSWEEEVTGLSTQNREIYIGTNGTTLDLPNPFANFTEVSEPTPAPTNLTDWNKALDFSGSSERAQMVSTHANNMPLAMDGLGNVVDPHSSAGSFSNVTGLTSDGIYARPWACAVVFKADRHNSNQHIWNQGEGASSGDDNIYLRLSATGTLHFGWGRDGAINEMTLATGISSSRWYGVYIGHTGARFSGAAATADNLAAAFDIRMMDSSDNFGSLSSNLSTTTKWSYVNGGRMDRSVYGTFTVGGRGANRSFHGKVASMVVTTLRTDDNMPTVAEIEDMIVDPIKWRDNTKVGNPYRWASGLTETNFINNNLYSSLATQIYLMGDGTSDNYSNMIRNQVMPSDQNYTKLNLLSMVSNDIQNVTIPGLS